MMNRMRHYLTAFAVAAMLAGCGVQESFKDAEIEVGAFHRSLDAGQLQNIWAAADPAFRQSTAKADFDKFLGTVHRKLGNVKEAKQTGWNANATTGGTFVTLTYQTRFERGSGVEQFVYRKGDEGKVALAGYNIQSQDMMMN